MVERFHGKEKVPGSIPGDGSREALPGCDFRVTLRRAKRVLGWIPERSKGPGCKPGGIAFVGSNPTPPTTGRLSSAGRATVL